MDLSSATAGAGRVDDGEVAGAVDIEDTGHTQNRIPAEDERVEIGVVDAPVDDVDLSQTLCGLHLQGAVDHHQVATLDQLGRPFDRRGKSARSRRCCGCLE